MIFRSGYAFRGGKGKETYHLSTPPCRYICINIQQLGCNSGRIKCGIFYTQQSWDNAGGRMRQVASPFRTIRHRRRQGRKSAKKSSLSVSFSPAASPYCHIFQHSNIPTPNIHATAIYPPRASPTTASSILPPQYNYALGYCHRTKQRSEAKNATLAPFFHLKFT